MMLPISSTMPKGPNNGGRTMAKRGAANEVTSAKAATVAEVPITVHRKVRGGWYMYTCDQLPGLYVASPDDRKAYDDLPTAIRKLVKLTYGIECVVAHKVEYRDFDEMAEFASRASAMGDGRTPGLLTGKSRNLSFVVQCVRSDSHA